MDDLQIIKLLDWFQEQWKSLQKEEVVETDLSEGKKALQVFCEIGRFQVLIRLIIYQNQLVAEHSIAIDPTEKIYCDRYKFSCLAANTGIFVDLYTIGRKIRDGADPQETCRQSLKTTLVELKEKLDFYQQSIEHRARLSSRKQIPMYRGGAPGLGKKR